LSEAEIRRFGVFLGVWREVSALSCTESYWIEKIVNFTRLRREKSLKIAGGVVYGV
jgi:hypothetical protein